LRNFHELLDKNKEGISELFSDNQYIQ